MHRKPLDITLIDVAKMNDSYSTIWLFVHPPANLPFLVINGNNVFLSITEIYNGISTSIAPTIAAKRHGANNTKKGECECVRERERKCV